MEQFSHDLTLALEETSRCGTRIDRWGMRRRTRSTGNLPCAPQPTEDSSSSPADFPNNGPHANAEGHGASVMLSDSDDRHELQLNLKLKQKPLVGNFESDSFNENFSPARPNTRRKRKLKKMAVEYETTPSTPGTITGVEGSMFPVSGVIKKRVLKHGQENTKYDPNRSNTFFCGKRKRSHRDRYYDHDKQHSSSVPRHRDVFLPKTSYLEYKSRSRSYKPCERIMPLNKSIVSKIEKISQESKIKLGFEFKPMTELKAATPFNQSSAIPLTLSSTGGASGGCSNVSSAGASEVVIGAPQKPIEERAILQSQQLNEYNQRVAHKSGSFESTFNFQTFESVRQAGMQQQADQSSGPRTKDGGVRKSKGSRRQDVFQFQFDDPTLMDCGTNDFSSSSSLSSDSEEIETNESDREGDDELTDWPGNEAMINFASKNDFKRAKPKPIKATVGVGPNKPDDMGQDDDTLMSGDEMISLSETPNQATGILATSRLGDTQPLLKQNMSMPIDITAVQKVHEISKQIESEMSGETSNHFYSSSNSATFEPREIRAGCRRIREERPGFSVYLNANEELARFLQDGHQVQLRLYDVEDLEKIESLAKLYSLNMERDNECTILTKTSNTTQSVYVEQTKLNKRLMLSDYKRRCYGNDEGGAAPPSTTESNEMAS